MTQFEWLRGRIHSAAGLDRVDGVTVASAVAETKAVIAMVPWVVAHARARLLMGAFRFKARDASGMSYDDRSRIGTAASYWDRAQEKLDLYGESGNQELLVDVFNYILLELTHRTHPKAHFMSLERGE